MASPRYVAGPLDVGRLGRSVGQVGGGAVVVWIWTWMRGPGHPMPWPMALAGAGMVCWLLVDAVRRRHALRALVVDDGGVRIERWGSARRVLA